MIVEDEMLGTTRCVWMVRERARPCERQRAKVPQGLERVVAARVLLSGLLAHRFVLCGRARVPCL